MTKVALNGLDIITGSQRCNRITVPEIVKSRIRPANQQTHSRYQLRQLTRHRTRAVSALPAKTLPEHANHFLQAVAWQAVLSRFFSNLINFSKKSRTGHLSTKQRKSTSGFTAGRALLYRVTKIMKIFREKTGGGGFLSVTAHIDIVVFI